jgi:hypothetical protein
MSYNIWKLKSPEALSGRKVSGSVSSKVFAATGISKIMVARIRKKGKILIKERQPLCQHRESHGRGRTTLLQL